MHYISVVNKYFDLLVVSWCYSVIYFFITQFQALCEASEQYDPGSQYIEYVKRIHVVSDSASTLEPFVFEQYTPELK